ncbi:MAG: DnaJ domain-containing protein [Acidobacteria bacterium]|nr:DnaJ domain-containing protein [Acidobacteriota bacterium]
MPLLTRFPDPCSLQMTPKNDLEIRGNFLTHPHPEVIAEIAHARLSGSLRIDFKEKKCVVYFREGRIIFAASNARSLRLYELLLAKGKLSKADLAKIPNFVNDFEFAAFLEDKGFLKKTDAERLFADQVAAIVVNALAWTDGDWTFSHLARARDGLDFKVKLSELLVDYARALPHDAVLKRFRSLDERFARSELPMNGLVLSQNEAFVLSRAETGTLTAADLSNVAAMPEAAALHVLYTMWLAGLLDRSGWQPAFSEETVNAIRSARLELKKEARIPDFTPKESKKVESIPEPAKPAAPKAPEITLTVEEYLERVETATTYYDVLGVDIKADEGEIKRTYFALAKMFHPDRYHSEGGELLKRVQTAFTEMSQAHETLKDSHQRELYDYRMRNEIAARKKAEETGESVSTSAQLLQAAESFDRGFTLLMNKEVAEALPLLARAVHYAPANARYHAYYGKALSHDETKRHKAESEMQAALKIDPQNTTFRLMLAEFFVDLGLRKRAEGELNRLLAVFPSNREARDMLDALKSS